MKTREILILLIGLVVLIGLLCGTSIYSLILERNELVGANEIRKENREGEFLHTSVLTISSGHSVLCEVNRSHYIDVINSWFMFREPQNTSDYSIVFKFSDFPDDVTVSVINGGSERNQPGRVVRNDNSYLQVVTIGDVVSTYSLYKLTGLFTYSSSWGGNLNNGKELGGLSSGIGHCRNI